MREALFTEFNPQSMWADQWGYRVSRIQQSPWPVAMTPFKRFSHCQQIYRKNCLTKFVNLIKL